MDATLCDRYRILNLLASGGFGETFLAIDLHSPTQRKVVVKALKSLNESTNSEIIEKLFLKEAQVLEELGNQHPQIPTLYAYFCQDNQYYLVQEYIEGKNLTQMAILSPQYCLSILLSLLETLKYVHHKNIIHRDIKPENIIIRESDGLPVLIDFGAVKETMGSLNTSSGSTVSSVIVGSTGFMAPEQSTGRTVFSTDLFALGLTIIYSLTGKYPIELPSNNLTGELEWQSLVTNLDPSLARVLNKAIKMDLPSRYLTAEAMLKDLQTKKNLPPTTVSLQKDTSSSTSLTPRQIVSSSSSVTGAISSSSGVQNFTDDFRNKNDKSSSNIIVILLVLLVALFASLLGFLIIQNMNQTQQQLAQAQREKQETEARLQQEQTRGLEEENKREEAQKLRLELEEEFRQEELRRKAEIRENNTNTIHTTSPSNNSNVITNAVVTGRSGRKNIRSGPGTVYSIVGTVYTGDAINVMGSDLDRGGYLWYRVSHPASGTTGWIAAQLVNY